MKVFSIVFFSLFIMSNMSAQHIQRKGGLGVSYYPQVPDSIAKKMNYTSGAIVLAVFPSTTAASIGIQANDIITSINSIKIVLPQDLLTAAKTLRENIPIEIELIRAEKKILLKGKVIAKPIEQSATANIVYGEFAYKNGYVRTIYKAPKDKMPLATIYFLQGLPCYSMDNFKDLDITKQAIDAMVDRGFAVYRMEKGDMGDNINTPPCETLGFTEELEMYKAGYKNLLSLKTTDTSKIFLFGHSMGGVTAPLLAQEFQPKGVIVYGTVFKPWLDYLFDANLLQPQYFGEDLANIRDTLESIKPSIYDYFYTNQSFEEIASTTMGLRALQQLINYDPVTKLAASGRSPLCHKELNKYNLAKAWKNTGSYVLAIYGECDIAAINSYDHQDLTDYVNKIHPGKATFWQAPGSTHTFEKIGTMEEFIKWQANPAAYYQYASTRFNPEIFEYSCNWMKEVLKK